jgi:hypothetical protein
MGVRLNGVTVDGYLVPEGEGTRIRITLDEAERLGLCPGQQVLVEGAGREPSTYLLSAMVESPPLVWLGFRPFKSRLTG